MRRQREAAAVANRCAQRHLDRKRRATAGGGAGAGGRPRAVATEDVLELGGADDAVASKRVAQRRLHIGVETLAISCEQLDVGGIERRAQRADHLHRKRRVILPLAPVGETERQ